ncbi:MAG: mechanosensitive ion channel family protein [Treponema sp.]|nr:mechanosensitive ion channel family protein [Treponema sp.]
MEFFSQWDNLGGNLLDLSKDIIVSIIIAITGMMIVKGFNKLIKKITTGKKNVDEHVNIILCRIIRYLVLIVCIIMILNIFGINTTSFIAILGAAGVAIGLALKDTLGNIAAGFVMIFLGSYRRGEFIEFGSFSGTVKEISLFTTILETPDGIFISAPNSSIWGSPLRNYSRNLKRRMELSVRISYSDSLETAFKVLKNIAESEPNFLPEPAPQVLLQSMQDSSVNLVIRAWAYNQNYWDVYWRQMRNLKEKIEEAGLHIPYPQRDVNIISAIASDGQKALSEL